MADVVVGIFLEADARTLERALSAQDLDLAKITVLSPDRDDDEEYALRFVDVVAETSDAGFADDMAKGTGVLPDSGGTGVPGVSSPEARLDAFSPPATTRHYLANFAVPEDEGENFDDAIAEGSMVVLYPGAGADAPKIAAAFKAAGLQHVRSY